MASRAFVRRRFVEEHSLALDLSNRLVAAGTNNVFVNAFERKTGALVVVKERRPPLGRVVTFRARGGARFGELLAVDVLMALLTLPGGRFEIHMNQSGFKI